MTPKEQLWRQYHDAIKAGKKEVAQSILKKIHQGPTRSSFNPAGRGGGGCSKCRKRWSR